MEETTIIQNWQTLIKPNKLNIITNEDKSITTLTAEPLEKVRQLLLQEKN